MSEQRWREEAAEALELSRRRKLTEAERRYEDEHGRDALARQQELARLLHRCCGEPNEGPHHLGCSKHKPDVLAVIHPEQEALI